MTPSSFKKDQKQSKKNPLVDEIKQFKVHKVYGGGLYSLKGALLEQNNMDPQSNYSAIFDIFVDIDILVDSVQVDQLEDVKRIMNVPV